MPPCAASLKQQNMKKAQSILFDLDGTLLDTAPDLVLALNGVLQAHGKPALPLEVARPYVSRGARGLLQCGFGLNEDSPDYTAYVEEFLDFYRNSLCEHTTLFDGMSALLDSLDDAKCLWGVVTNKAAGLTMPLLKEIQLYDRLHVLVCGDTLPEKKPSPRPLLYACGMAGMLPEETIYVGDDRRDIDAANAAGMLSVAARYGYYDASDSPDNWGADLVIEHPGELDVLLESRG
jgi:2-phosphoglycolate phosphatase